MTLYPANLLNSFVEFILYNYIFCKLYNLIALSLILIYCIYFSSLNFFFAYTYTVYSDQIKVFSVSLMLSHSSRALWILLCLKYSFTNLPPCFPNHPLILYYSNILHGKISLHVPTHNQTTY